MNKYCGSALLLMGLLGSASVVAETDREGFYVGGDIGSTELDFDGGVSHDAEYSVGVYGGYHFNDWFGVEGHLFGTGDYSNDSDFDSHASAFSIAPKLTLAFNDIFSAYVKAGLAYMVISNEVDTVYGTYTNDLSGVGYVFGAGVNAAVSDNLVLRVAYEKTSGDLEFEHDFYYYDDISTDLSQFSVGMHYQF
ncbi:porin family protein [uncultured Shewanella sp.]|uniref:outer membrane protein n=1 Tax=uncultured Shewanella sp. TaxID=173975 RepID=UPI0026026807|nr:porin family protein [uncultured Shewanella sp.]